MVHIVLRLLLVGMVKFLMVRMDVYVHLVLIGMVNGVKLIVVQEDKNGMVVNVHVNKVITLMELYVYYV